MKKFPFCQKIIIILFISTMISANALSQAVMHVSVNQNAELQSDAGDNVTVSQGDSIEIGGSPTATGGGGEYSYNWMPNININDITLANPVIYTDKNITYTVIVTDKNGCTSSDSASVQITTGINNIDKSHNSNIQIIPNPNTGQFRLIANNLKGEYTLEIFNISGQLVLNENIIITSGNFNKEIIMPNRKKGMYYLKIARENYSLVKKFIVH